MTTLYAQPYNIDATGFYFDSAEDYAAKAKGNYDCYGQFVEEYEIQFIDGEAIDCERAKVIGLSQCNFSKFFDLIDEWDEGQKVRSSSRSAKAAIASTLMAMTSMVSISICTK